MPRMFILLALTTWAALTPAARAEEPKPKPVSFVREIRPILAKNCFACHGPDEAKRKGKLRLDTKEGAFAERDGSRPFVPGSPDDSEVLFRVTAEDPTLQMPPPGHDAPRLTPEQVALLKRWVEEGATWGSHWAFETPKRPAPPKVDDESWPRNPIDRFVLARLEAEGLRPAPEADRRTLARRVALDLTGLPPSSQSVDRFLADPAPDAYETFVDGLLQSPAYGERWARVWLDLARYADTKGYEKDLTRTIWRYRDWVIAAFNADMPYDRFTTEQLAGDLLPGATPDQVLATAFHRNTLTNDEGGTDDEEFRIAAVKDRVDTTAQVWMGLTMGCAKCHTHKYDPISHREYYQFLAFFNQTADNDRSDDSPAEPFPTAEARARIEALKVEIARREAELYAPTPDRLAALKSWEEARRAETAWTVLRPEGMQAASGSTMKRLDDDSVLVAGAGPESETYNLRFPAGSKPITAVRIEAIPDPALPKGGTGRSKDDGNFVLTGIGLSLQPKGGGAAVELKPVRAEADFEQAGYPVAHVLANPDPKKHGWAVAPKIAERHQAAFHLAEPAEAVEGGELVVRLDHQFAYQYPGFSLGRFRVSVTDSVRASLTAALPAPILAILKTPEEKRTGEQALQILRYFVDNSPETKAGRDEIARRKSELDGLFAAVRTPIVRELPADKRRVTKIHNRGNFLDQGAPVEPATPAGFHPFPGDAPRDRLGVARWLMDPANPLTARVAVNRHWSQFFGRGLVETQEDFGSQGQPPSHPELLDWLAVEFRERGWSFKELCRLIVTSATYRQSSRATPELVRKDRHNRLLARGPRFRLDAETIRDSALAVSGLLSRKMYGPSVMPYQPEGIWRSTYNTDRWTTSPGEDRHRRTLYTFLKRTSPYPALLMFDAPSRELCTVRRISTNTPLQALVTLNDAVYVEAAQALARRMAKEGGPALADRVAYGLELAVARPPRPAEVEALVALYGRRLEAYRNEPESARKLATEPIGPLPDGADAAELAALTSVANVILNLDEFLTRN